MTDEEFLLSEYGATAPLKFYLDGEELIVPASYKGDIDAFTDDLTSFQNGEYKRYEHHNKKYPDSHIEPIDVVTAEGLHVIVPLSYAQKDIFDKKGEIKPKYKKRVLQEFYQKTFKRYHNAIKKTRRYKREYPLKDITTSLSQRHLSECSRSHTFYVIGKTVKSAAKVAKWTAKEAMNVVVGAAASPLALAYKFMDKKCRIAESSKKKWIDEKALPYVKRGAIRGLATFCLAASLQISLIANEKYQQYKKEKAQKEAFFKKYDTTDDIFYQNYKIAKENEAMIIALIACPEGFRSEAYLCEAEKCTIGYGCTETIVRDENGNIIYDEKGFAKTIPVKLGDKTTKEKAFEDTQAHLEKEVYTHFRHINRILEKQENGAVCMFIYNTGGNNFNNSMLCNAINSNESDKKVREAFSIIRSIGGKRSYGLINRHGFEGYIWCQEDLSQCVFLKPTIAGSPDITYYEYGTKNKKDPLENADNTFVVRDIENVEKDAKRFITYDLSRSIISMLPQNKRDSILKANNITVDEKGKMKTPEMVQQEQLAQQTANNQTKVGTKNR